MKKTVSLLIVFAVLCCIGVGAFAFEEYVFDENYAVKDAPSLNFMAQDIYNSTGVVISCFIGNSDDSANGHEHAQKLFKSHFDDAEGMILVDRLDDEKLYFYCTSTLNEKMTHDASMALLEVYNSQYDYDSAVREYILTADKMLEKLGYYGETVEEAVETPTAPVIPDSIQVRRVSDNAGVLSLSDLNELNAMADSVSEQFQCDVCAVFVNGTDGKDIQAFADDYYDYNGCGYGDGDDGILLAVDVVNRKFAVSTYGYGIEAFTDYGQQYLDSKYIPELRESDWEDAAQGYIEGCGELLYRARNGQIYDVGSPADTRSPFTPLLLGDLFFGFVISFVTVGGMKKKLKSVAKKTSAGENVRPGSFHLAYTNDRFIRSSVSRTKKPEPQQRSGGGGGSSVHFSSSGRSHGGHSGSF